MTQEQHNRLTTENEAGEERDITSDEVSKIYDTLAERNLDPRDPMFVFNVATRYKNGVLRYEQPKDEFDLPYPNLQFIQLGRTSGKSEPFPKMMVVSTPKGPHDESMAARLCRELDKAPWEVSLDGHPPIHVDVANGQDFSVVVQHDVPLHLPGEFVPQPPIWGHPQVVMDDSELSKLFNKMRVEEMNVDFAAQVVNQSNNDFNKMIFKQTAEAMGISPELLEKTVESESTAAFQQNWLRSLRQTGKSLRVHEAFMRDLLISMRKMVKAKRHHRNAGSMRQRRMRYYFTRIDKDISANEMLLKNAYPVSMGDFVETPDGKIEMTVEFRYNEPPISLEPATTEVAMRAYQGPDGRLDITSFDLINKGPYANPSTLALDVQSDTQT